MSLGLLALHVVILPFYPLLFLFCVAIYYNLLH